jgi:hypothetical protein
VAARHRAFKSIRRRAKGAVKFLRRHRLLKPLVIAVSLTAIVVSAFLGYYYVQFSRIIEVRLHGERDRVIPRVFARPLTFNTGQVIGESELVARLNDVGYSQKGRAEQPGEFALDARTVAFIPRGGEYAGRPVVISFTEPPARKAASKAPPPPTRVARIEIAGKRSSEVSLDPPALSGLITGLREKRRRVALDAIPPRCSRPCWPSRTAVSLSPRRGSHPHGGRAHHQRDWQPHLPRRCQHRHAAAGP